MVKYMLKNLRTGKWNKVSRKTYFEYRKAGWKKGYTKKGR